MPVSTRLFASLLASAVTSALTLALTLALTFALGLAAPLHAAAAPGGAADAIDDGGLASSGVPGGDALGDATGAPGGSATDGLAADGLGAANAGLLELGVPAGWDTGNRASLDAAARIPATPCRPGGACQGMRPAPRPPAPEAGALGILGFGLALVLLRGQRPANLRFGAQ